MGRAISGVRVGLKGFKEPWRQKGVGAGPLVRRGGPSGLVMYVFRFPKYVFRMSRFSTVCCVRDLPPGLVGVVGVLGGRGRRFRVWKSEGSNFLLLPDALGAEL